MGSIASAIGDLFGGGSQGAQNDATGAQNDIANQQSQAFGQYYHPALQSYLQQSGYNPSTGQFDPNFDPLGGSANALTMQYEEKAQPQYDQAVANTQHDLMGRGFSGANSVTPEVVSQIRGQQASDNANFTRNLGIQSNEERYQRMGSALNAVMGGGRDAANTYGNVSQQYGQQAQQDNSSLLGLGGLIGGFL